MNTRLALLFEDGSILVFPVGTEIGTARREAEDHDGDGPRTTRVAEIEILQLREIDSPA